MLKKISLSSFLCGFITCFILVLIIFGTVTKVYLNRGITVSIELTEITPLVTEEVNEIIQIQLPQFVDNLKKEIPYIIDAEMTGQINNVSIRVGDMEYPLPRDSIKGIEETFKSQVQIAMVKLLEGLDEEVVAQSISRDVAIKVDEFIDENVHNHRINLNPFSKFTIPITIHVHSDNNK